jgi:hypothetical protein
MVYERCPFCERVFGVADDEARLRCHARVAHAEPEREGRYRGGRSLRPNAG